MTKADKLRWYEAGIGRRRDADVAMTMGCSARRVQQVRSSLGVARWRQPRVTVNIRQRQAAEWAALDWSRRNQDLAQRLRVGVALVRCWRYRLRLLGYALPASGEVGLLRRKQERRGGLVHALPSGSAVAADKMEDELVALREEVTRLRKHDSTPPAILLREGAEGRRLSPAAAADQALHDRDGVYHRNRLLVTTLRAIRVLGSGRWRVEELAAQLGERKRTAYRILNAIEATGIALERHAEGKEAYYRIPRSALTDAIGGT